MFACVFNCLVRVWYVGKKVDSCLMYVVGQLSIYHGKFNFEKYKEASNESRIKKILSFCSKLKFKRSLS